MRKIDYTKALTIGFLTPCYDFLQKLIGMGDVFYLDIASYIAPKNQAEILHTGARISLHAPRSRRPRKGSGNAGGQYCNSRQRNDH